MGLIINPYSLTSFSNRYYAAFGGSPKYAFRSGFSLNGLGAFTVSLMMRTTTSAGTTYFISFPDASAGSNGVDVYMAGNILKATIRTAAGTTLDTGDVMNDGLWHNIMLVYTGANVFLYVDGVQQATAAKTGTIDCSANETNLARFGTFGGYMVVDMDEISVWNIGLDATGRAAVWDTTPKNIAAHANVANCLAWWRWDNTLDDMTGTTGTIRDNIGTNHLTPFGTVAADKVLY